MKYNIINESQSTVNIGRKKARIHSQSKRNQINVTLSLPFILAEPPNLSFVEVVLFKKPVIDIQTHS